MATDVEISEIDHRIASEEHRFETFSSLLNFPSITRHQLALAGFIYRQETECICPQCEVSINLQNINENNTYEANYFRKLHRIKALHLGKRCAFLLCQSGTNIDNLHPALPSQQKDKPQWDDAEQPEFSDYSVRLETFQTWPHLQQEGNTFVTPSAMAKHGFYFSGPNDGVTCFYCGNTLTDWSEAIRSSNKNIVQLEHARFFPCRFITYTAGEKFVGEAGHFHIVSDEERQARNPMPSKSMLFTNKPQSIEECLLTFEKWPENAPILAKKLADTGFYYLGYELRVKCYMCDVEVDWQHGMTALGTHSELRPNCEIVRAIYSTKTRDSRCVDERWRLKTLDGYSDDQHFCRELAACGFYRHEMTKNIRCAYCGLVIEPKTDSSIMSQHRHFVKLKRKTSILDCQMVRAQCPTNILIPDRERFPEYREYQTIFERMKSFDSYKERHKIVENFIRDRAEAGFFLDTMKRMRCFQCGNSLPINDKKLHEKYHQYDIAKLHAHFYPTCEWIKEILGSKYIAQVIFDRTSSNEIQQQQSYHTQSSSTSSTTVHSFASVPTTPGSMDLKSPIETNISDYAEESDEEGYEPVATPHRAQFMGPITPPLSYDSTTTTAGGTLESVGVIDDGHKHLTSPISINGSNPLEQLAFQPTSPPFEISHTDISPVDLSAFFAYESHRLDSFKKRNREVFAQIRVEELANAGFYLNAENTVIECPWCHINVNEAKVERILRRPPIIPDAPLNDEPWTAMRIHRHENGRTMDGAHPWCPFVRRELGGLYPNVMITENFMRYPEYPSYSIIEKRIKSFESDWIYPSGSRLSNAMMADAGFLNFGKGKVCCYYCGNKLCDFEPLDCPFEEHALYHPLCDYIIKKRGPFFIKQILKDTPRTPHAKLKTEVIDTQKLKWIYFDRSGPSINKNQRQSVKRVHSQPSTRVDRSLSYPTTNNLNIADDGCDLCCENVAIYVYDPCQHLPMCKKCSEQLRPEQREECMVCRQRAKINFRLARTPF